MSRLRNLAAFLCLVAGAAHSQSACDNFFGQRCVIALSTGIRMSYFELGPQTAPAVILLHTDTTTAVEWAWTVGALLELNPALHVFALDQRGAAMTGLPDTERCWRHPNLCITRADLAADVLAFMDARHIARATLVGHAMGAGAARKVALLHPERVERLILSGTGIPAAAAHAAPQARQAEADDDMSALGWKGMAQAKGVKWPQGALHLRPLDLDPDAVRNIVQHWDISAIADPEAVRAIAAQSAMESLATWERLDPTPVPPDPPDHWHELSVPVLALWGSEDSGLDRESQQRMVAQLRRAAQTHPGMTFYWKQYGVRPPPASGDKHDADDIGHNLSWEAPRQLAADIDRFIRTGKPTPDRYRTDAPRDIHHIIVEPGKADIESSEH